MVLLKTVVIYFTKPNNYCSNDLIRKCQGIEKRHRKCDVIASDGLIKESDLPPLFPVHAAPATNVGSYQEQLAQYRKQILLLALKESGGNRTEAAKKLGLHQKIRKPRILRIGKYWWDDEKRI